MAKKSEFPKYYLDPRTPEELQEMFRYTGEKVPFLSAHRGGPYTGFPENCIETFENTISHTYALLEIDLIYSKDSAIMLHHDYTLERTTTGHGQFSAETYAIIMSTFEDAVICHQRNKNLMMQVFMGNHDRVREFEQTGVPWQNVVVFVTHDIPDDPSLFDTINQRGALCIVGTHRTLDRKVLDGRVSSIEELKEDYLNIYQVGADIIETDIPVLVSRIVADRLAP